MVTTARHQRDLLASMTIQKGAPYAGAMNTVATVAPGRCTGLMPEFVRPADAVCLFGVGKSTLADWIARGFIRSHLVRREGNKSGLRLISTSSLRKFIEGHGAKEKPTDAAINDPTAKPLD
jgi:hypothetical protein